MQSFRKDLPRCGQVQERQERGIWWLRKQLARANVHVLCISGRTHRDILVKEDCFCVQFHHGTPRTVLQWKCSLTGEGWFQTFARALNLKGPDLALSRERKSRDDLMTKETSHQRLLSPG